MARLLAFSLLLLVLASVTWSRTVDSNDDEAEDTFGSVETKLDDLFDTFDDVITERTQRSSKGKGNAQKDDDINEKLFGVVQDAENLDDDISYVIDDLNDVNFDDSSEDSSDEEDQGNLEEDLDILHDDAKTLVNDARRLAYSLETNSNGSKKTGNDPLLKVEMESVKVRTADVLNAVSEAERKIKRKMRQSSNIKDDLEGYLNEEPQSDSPSHDSMHRYSNLMGSDEVDEKPATDPRTAIHPNDYDPRVPATTRINLDNPQNDRNTDPYSRRLDYPDTTSARDRLEARRRQIERDDRLKRLEMEARRKRMQPSRQESQRSPFAMTEDFGRSNRQYFDVTGLEKYAGSCTDCVNMTTQTTCPLNNEVLEMKKWANELQQLLRFGCQKPEKCLEPGICCIMANDPFEQTIVQMSQMLKDVYALLQDRCTKGCFTKPPPGQLVEIPKWNPWSEWSPCDVTCGEGIRERRRSCDSKNGDLFCNGTSIDTEICVQAPCCQDGNWAFWSSWSGCSASCGQGVQERSRMCSNPSPNFCGQRCPGQATDRKFCTGPRDCCVDGNWATWSRWSQCSASCGQGVASRSRRCASPAPNHCGNTCLGEAEQDRRCGSAQDCCVDGDWSSWNLWSGCSVSCGLGSRSRLRRCDNPTPNFCGQRCTGRSMDTSTCSPGQCCVDGVWGQWANWESCSSTCGRGNQLRRRRCDSPGPNSCGRTCMGKPVDVRDCNEGSCCVDGNWGSWMRWSQCSATCGQGARSRSRNCDNPSPDICGLRCPGQPSQRDMCDTGLPCITCIDGNWASWQMWSECSSSCGRGIKQRVRTCDNPSPTCGADCVGPPSSVRPCDSAIVDGNWGVWTRWSSCSATCGNGQRERMRVCDNPPRNICGQDCFGDLVDMENCNEGSCIDCFTVKWNSWSPWSRCSATCDEGLRKRSRTCNNPHPLDCRDQNYCIGDRSEEEPCGSGRSCCDGVQWTTWSSWASCSASCGQGVQERMRDCLNPFPGNCPDSSGCVGMPKSERSCDSGRSCCVDGNWAIWSSWSSCSVTCGFGTREKRRRCSNPPENYCGKTCSGPDFETDICTKQPCITCVDGNWGSWESWSSCSVSCDTGTRERRRYCNNPPSNFCGSPCQGKEYETGTCDTRVPCKPKCVDGRWGLWSSWSSCPVSCGRSTVERYRSCDAPAPNSCGEFCFGNSVDTKSTLCGPLAVNGNWSPWAAWTECSKTCGPGERLRSRRCNSPSANACGDSCPGPDQDYDRCDDRPCEQCGMRDWTEWGRWSPCSATCDFGNRKRSRYCEFLNPLDVNERDCGSKSYENCRGDSDDEEPCRNLQPCPAPNYWSPWGACSLTCRGSNGVRERLSMIRMPNGQYEPDLANRERESCSTDSPECPSWGSWAPCSATCRGRGVRERRQFTRTPLGLLEADASQVEREPCLVDFPECPRVTEWGTWGPCSVTCRGPGTRQRRLMYRTDLGSLEADTTQVQTERCQVYTPECPSWGPWGPCSATCRGDGMRERRIETRTNLGSIAADSERVERERCQTYAPECQPDAFWGPWAKWCPCDCRTGRKSRRRECFHENPLTRQREQVSLNHCRGGEGRQQLKCDVVSICPECISSCSQRPDGVYPSCTACTDYIRCINGQGEDMLLKCSKQNTAFDAFVGKCVTAPSPSCSLKECTNGCQGQADGAYHACQNCSSFRECQSGNSELISCPDGQMEFNAHFGTCMGTRSPTCMRTPPSRLRFPDFPFNDAPADEYYDEGTGLTATERREKYEEERKKSDKELMDEKMEEERLKAEEAADAAAAAAAAATPKGKKTEKKDKEEELYDVVLEGDEDEDADDGLLAQMKDFIASVTSTPPTVPNCISTCDGVKRGRYPSCKGCDHYWQCYKSGDRLKKCPSGKVWDQSLKECNPTSTTCPGN